MSEFTETIHSAINEGYSLQQISKSFNVDYIDLTSDGVPEINFEIKTTEGLALQIAGCADRTIGILLTYPGNVRGSPHVLTIEDINQNGVPDIVLFQPITTTNSRFLVLEWNGDEFVSLVQANLGDNSYETSAFAKSLYWYTYYWTQHISQQPYNDAPILQSITAPEISDLDGDGIKELVVEDSPCVGFYYWCFEPSRGRRIIFKWDGFHYLYSFLEMERPEYRFQAVQDADRYYFMGEENRAFILYQEVINSSSLEWWSPEKIANEIAAHDAELFDQPTPTPVSPDQDEYLMLVAYAKYRIILYHLSLNHFGDAELVNGELQDGFPKGTMGSVFSEMAEIVMSHYQQMGDLRVACSNVVSFVTTHLDILQFLGGEDHGEQSHIYEPIDVCPYADPLLAPPLPE
jgi:hypothetical protein